MHSGDSSCVLPAPSRPGSCGGDRGDGGPACTRARVVGLVNVQLALADGELFVLEANPRASRTVPFASKAIGINLVESGLPARGGAPLSNLDLPRDSPRNNSVSKLRCCRSLVSPGPTPCLGPRCARPARSPGEAQPACRPLSRRPSVLREALPSEGTTFLSVRDADKPAVIEIAHAPCRASASASSPQPGLLCTLAGAGIGVEHVHKVTEEEGATVVDLVRRGRALSS